MTENTTSINYVIGDATSPIGESTDPIIIIHICNDIGAWGKGFVKALSAKWRVPEMMYRQWSRTKEFNGVPFELGEVQFLSMCSENDNVFVANMIAQHDIRYNGGVPPIRYDALKKCLKKVAEFALDYDRVWEMNDVVSVHAPRIGAGLAGGDWAQIESLIQQELVDKGIPVTIYTLQSEIDMW